MSTYKNIEEALKLINTKYVSLNTEEVKSNNESLRSTLWNLIGIMQKQDALFDKLFEQPYFGGSYYDDLKVGNPDEFDLDLLLVLPKICETHKIKSCGCVKVTPSNKPGFFWFQIQKGFCAGLDKFIIDGYIQTDKVLNWLKSNVIIALNKFANLGGLYGPSVKYSSESGPALTLQIDGSFGKMDVDLVPAFKFGPEHWPTAGYIPNKTTRSDFFIVPKKPKGMMIYGERYWRASFQDQERELIKGKERLKPALRLLKKMRNNLVQKKISSYALKTIVLLEIDNGYFNWNETLGDTFMKLLEKYKERLGNNRIPYYWNKNNNLLDNDGISPSTLFNHCNEISGIMKKIKDQYMTNPCIVAKIILKEGTADYNNFLAEYRQQTPGGNGLSVTSSSQGTSYPTFNPSSTYRDSTFPPQLRNDATSSSFRGYSSESTTQQNTESSTSGWPIAGGIILGIGAAAALGLGIFGALKKNNRR